MPRALLIVDAKIDPSVEKEWNAWYDNKHFPEILACPYFEDGARYVTEDRGVRRYLAVYKLMSQDAVTTPEFASARGWAEFKEKVEASTRLYTRLDGAPRD
jgi:hypothetical protein